MVKGKGKIEKTLTVPWLAGIVAPNMYGIIARTTTTTTTMTMGTVLGRWRG